MENAPYEGDDRRARRRQVKARHRRSLIIGLVVVAVAAASLAGVVMLAGRSSATSADEGSATLAPPSPASQSSAAGSASPAPPSPSPSPTKPPLDKPTTKHPLRVYFGGDSLAGLPGVLFAQHAAKSGLMKVRTDFQVSSRLTNTDPVDWPARLKAQLGAGHPDVGVF